MYASVTASHQCCLCVPVPMEALSQTSVLVAEAVRRVVSQLLAQVHPDGCQTARPGLTRLRQWHLLELMSELSATMAVYHKPVVLVGASPGARQWRALSEDT
jgi:hypothetical protein